MAVVGHVAVNPCCELLQKKESKLSQKLVKSEEGRNFLKKAIGILQEKIVNFEAEKVKLKEQLEIARKNDKIINFEAENVKFKEQLEVAPKNDKIVNFEAENVKLKEQLELARKKDREKNNQDFDTLDKDISWDEKVAEISILKEQLQKEQMRAENEQKVAEIELKKANEALQRAKAENEKLQADNEREMKMNESTIRVSLENEISSLKSQITVLQQQIVSGAQDAKKEATILQECVFAQKQEINQLKELLQIEKDRADSEKVLSESETEINRLKKLLQKEKKRSDSEKKKAETEKCRADKVLADSEITLKEKEQAVRLSLGSEISALECQIQLLQQEIAVRDEKKEVNLYQSLVSEKEAEINQLKKLAKKESTRAESEKKKAEAEKKKVNESQKIAKTEKSRADEERMLADIERKKVEEAGLQLEALRDELRDLRANLESEALKVQLANVILETEKQKVMTERQRADMEMTNAEEQSKLLESTRREIAEERARADSLSLQLDEDRVRIMKLQKEIAELVSSRNTGNDAGDLSVEHLGLEAVKLKGGPHIEVMYRESGASKMVLNCLQCEELIKKLKDVKQEAKREKERADSEMRKAEYQRKVADTYGEKAKMETDRCLELAGELEDNRCKTEKLKKEMQELVLSGKLVDTVERKNRNSDTTNMKLLRKSLKLERMQTKHAKQVASLERDRNILLQQKIRCIKEAFYGITDQLDILDKCSSHGDVGISDLEKNSNVSRRQGKKRKVLDEELCQVQHSGNELVKCTTPLLSSKEFVPFAEKSIRCPLRINAVGHEAGHHEKRKRSLDANESAEHMYREGKKRCRQIAESVSVLQDMLECSTGKRFRETGVLLPSINCTNQELKNPVSREELAMQHLNMSDELKTHSHPNDSRSMSDVTGITLACNEETVDASRNSVCSFNEVEDGNYLKLLSLDNPLDEEIYQAAIERPLSPTLPETGPLSVGAHENDNNDHIDVVSPVSINVVPLCCPYEEIDSGKLNANNFGTCHVPLLPRKGINVSSGSKIQSCSPRYYVIFSDMSGSESITKILSATRTCMAQSSMLPQTDHVVQVMSTLLKVEGLLSREMVCVFFSLLLQNISEFTLENLKNLTDGGLVRSFELFVEQVRSDSKMDDLETRSIEDLLNLEELFRLIEDFLIHRRVLLHRDVLSESLSSYDPKSDIIVSDGDMFSFQVASDPQLISASVVLASICSAFDRIGFVCETSYNLLKMQNIDSSTLAILHVFAYISGAKYFTNCDHTLFMTVLKSLVVFLERQMSSTSVVQLGFPPCKNCPYAMSAISMDVVVSLLIKKLHNYILSNVSYDPREAMTYINEEAPCSNENTEPSSGDGEIPRVHSSDSGTLLYLGDVLSLLELLASIMNWSWSFTNIVLKLLDILDSCGIEKLVPAIVLLLGQLGRIGVDANGYDDTGVETLRSRLCSFLHRKASAITELPFQIATVTALLGVVPLRFEEIFKRKKELSEVVKDSDSADCIRNWFSFLSEEHQSLSIRLFNNVASLRNG